MAAAAAAATTFLEKSALEQARDGAEARATAYVPHIIEPIFGDKKPTGPINAQVGADLTTQLDAAIFGVDAVVGRVRVWSPSGELWYSTDDADQVGESKSDNLTAIKTAVKGDAKVTATVTSGPEPRLTIFAPLRIAGPPSAVVEIDDNVALIESRARRPWSMARTGAILLAALFGLLTLLSLAPSGRTSSPAMPVRAFLGEGEAPAKPKGESKGESKPEPGNSDAPPQSEREWERMRSKLDKSEAGRKALELELEQLRGQISNGHDQSAGRVRDLEDQLAEANTRLRGITAFTPGNEHQERIRELEAQLVQASARAASVEAKALDLTSNVTHSESMAQRLQAEAEEARRELATVASRIAAAESRVSDAELKATEAENAKAEIKSKLDALQEELRWSQAQQTETQPILQEASAGLQEAKSRADEALARATKMEERALDAEAAATRLEERLAAAEQRAEAAETGAQKAGDAPSSDRLAELERMLEDSTKREQELSERASDLELRLRGSSDATVKAVANAEAATSELAEVKTALANLQASASAAGARAAEVEARHAEIEQELLDTRARLQSATEDVEVAQVRVAEPDGDEESSAKLESLRTEIERLTGELARTIESAHSAEEKSARLEAEMVAMRKAASNGDDPAAENGSADDEKPSRPAPRAKKSAPAPPPEESAEQPEQPWEGEEPSLRSRLARTAARKKGRARGDDDALRSS
jgi:hypothetical protein